MWRVVFVRPPARYDLGLTQRVKTSVLNSVRPQPALKVSIYRSPMQCQALPRPLRPRLLPTLPKPGSLRLAIMDFHSQWKNEQIAAHVTLCKTSVGHWVRSVALRCRELCGYAGAVCRFSHAS